MKTTAQICMHFTSKPYFRMRYVVSDWWHNDSYFHYNCCRARHLDIGPTEHDPKVEVPTLLIMGEEDYAMKIVDEWMSDGKEY